MKLEVDQEQILENTFTKDDEKGIKLVQMVYGSQKSSLVLFEDKNFSKKVELEKVFSVFPKEYKEIYEKSITEVNDEKKQVNLLSSVIAVSCTTILLLNENLIFPSNILARLNLQSKK